VAVTRIFDNISEQLGPNLLGTFEQFDSLDVAVGYFNLRGWGMFSELVDAKTVPDDRPVCRVLIGMVSRNPQEEALDELQGDLEDRPHPLADHTVGKRREAELLAHLREQLMRGIPTISDRAALQDLRRHIDEGRVALKVYTRRPLHGKTYIFHRQDLMNPRAGFVGSSNLTAPGLLSNYELNVDVLDFNAAEDLAGWFEDRWNDPFSYEISSQLLGLLDESWASPMLRSPYEVYLKLCYDLSKDVRDGLAEYDIAGPIGAQLLDFQKEAVQTLARRLGFRGGTMLGDVVGLGKTLTAVAVALLLLEEERYSTLVICPKNLVEMWQDHLHEYQVPGAVVPYSMAAKELPDLRRYHLVIVDESHTLRSDTRQDYQALHRYIRENASKVLLLTATPYNVGFKDVANQIGLYLDPDTDLGIEPSEALRKDPRLADKVDGKTSTLAAFRESIEPDDWKRLMSEHLVRRTRTFIKRQAEDAGQVDDRGVYLTFADGSRFHFPTRVPRPLDHTFGEDDPAALMAAETTLDVIDELLLPRYDLRQYVRGKGILLIDDEQALIEKWERGRGQVKGFVQTNFYKRLSSCGHSFILSLRRHADRNRLFLHALDHDLPLPTGTVLDAMFSTADTDGDFDTEDDQPAVSPQAQYDALRSKDPASITWVRSELFTGDLTADLRRDTAALEALIASFGDWSPTTDSKLARLIKLITQDHPEEKILIFTEYKDTADYIAAALRDHGIAGVGVTTGDTENPTEVARQFSPTSNAALVPEGAVEHHVAAEDEYRVLVATDVLSEGQNLQDAHIVVNYDLPWAIIKLIQRAGRVDRIGQMSSQVIVYSLFHNSMEDVIDLRGRIKRRLESNAQAFGSDEQFFGDPKETQFLKDLYDGKLDEEELEADVDAASLAYQVWRKATAKDPELAERIIALPDLLTATRAPASLTRTLPGLGAWCAPSRAWTPSATPPLTATSPCSQATRCCVCSPANQKLSRSRCVGTTMTCWPPSCAVTRHRWPNRNCVRASSEASARASGRGCPTPCTKATRRSLTPSMRCTAAPSPARPNGNCVADSPTRPNLPTPFSRYTSPTNSSSPNAAATRSASSPAWASPMSKQHLAFVDQGRLQELFLEHLGWSAPSRRRPLTVTTDDGTTYTVTEVAEYGGLGVWHCPALPPLKHQRAVDAVVSAHNTERLIIFTGETQQQWRWPRYRTQRASANPRLVSHTHTIGEPDSSLADKLDLITIPPGSAVTVPELLSRMRDAFDEESETASVAAARLMGHLYGILEADHVPADTASLLLARLLFLMFGDDTKMWHTNLFHDLIADHTSSDGTDLAATLADLFDVLNTAESDRAARVAVPLAVFPYVNGGLFEDEIRLPPLSRSFRKALIDACRFDWGQISPAVFGSMFQTVKSKEDRRETGEHYTTEANILKTIEPLFLDDLRAWLEAAWDDKAALTRLHNRLKERRYLDPACGCGNFLIVAYRELRELELELLKRRRDLDLLDGKTTGPNRSQLSLDATIGLNVTLDQFHGIEIEPWPARIAETAMFLVDHQANMRMEQELGIAPRRLPIRIAPKIVNANALRIDWADILGPTDNVFVFGNPPFNGARTLSPQARADMNHVWGARRNGNFDYVTCWYRKALDYYGKNAKGSWAYVSTSSVCQGEPAADLWQPILDQGWGCRFAHRSLRWESEARDAAGVHVSIVGFDRDKSESTRELWTYPEGGVGDPTRNEVSNISPYLVPGPNILVRAQRRPVHSALASPEFGHRAIDNGGPRAAPDSA
jgi:superfamily II DNA or RNA helicase